MKSNDIITYCNTLLSIADYKDYCPNGLQVEGDERDIKHIILGVSLSEELIDITIQEGADMVICHHGLLWNSDERVVKGPYRRKLEKLLLNGISAASYHLPLDFHPALGNNIQLAQKLGLKNIKGFLENPKYAEGIVGQVAEVTIGTFAQTIEQELKRKPTVLPFGKERISKVGIVTGGAQGYFEKAIEAGVDCFITGEVSEKNYGMSQEFGVHFISAGHYATEKFGIQALGQRLQEEFNISTQFIEVSNPV